MTASQLSKITAGCAAIAEILAADDIAGMSDDGARLTPQQRADLLDLQAAALSLVADSIKQ